MTVFLRTVGAVGLAWVFAIGAPIVSAADADGSTGACQSCSTGACCGPIQCDGNCQPVDFCAGDCGTCHPTCGDCADCCCDPAWSISAGAVFLQRSRPNPAAIATVSGGPGVLVDASSFDFNYEAGLDLDIKHRSENGLVWEARYFNDRSDVATFDLNKVTTFRLAGIGVTILGGGDVNSIDTSRLDSTEFNLGLQLNERCTLFGGFRAVEFQDKLNVLTANIPNIWFENNHLYGGQLGVDLNLFNPGGRFQVNSVLKTGIYDNSASNRLTSFIVSGASATDNGTAFVSELDFIASYQITRHLQVRGGYMVLWIDDVSLAGIAASRTTQGVGGSVSPISQDGSVWYNGATASLEINW